jgi:hypothetical protein
MKTKKYLLSLTLVSLLAVSLLALPAKGLAALTEIEPVGAIEAIITWLITIILVVAALFIVLAAFTFVTAGGDPEKVNAARNQVMYALIGVAVALLAYGLVLLVKRTVGAV